MYNLTHFSLKDMTTCGAALRSFGQQAQTMEQVAGQVVQHLYEELVSASDERACVLVRFFKTHAFGQLETDLQRAAAEVLDGQSPQPDMKCLTLLATAGLERQWNDRRQSAGHQAIPLPSPEAVKRLPMISRMIQQFGLPVGTWLRADSALFLETGRFSYNVFHVQQALGSPYIPAQEQFVKPYGVESVVGFGGQLPSGDLFAVILFSRLPIGRSTAEMFRPLAMNTLIAVLPFDGGAVFRAGQQSSVSQMQQLLHQLDALQQLLAVHEQAVCGQADELETTLKQLRRRAGELARSNEELEQFAYVASHDLQEPLRKVQAFGNMLAAKYQDQLGQEGLDYLQRMNHASERMQKLINDLLAFSRITTRTRPFQPVDVGAVAAEVVQDLEARLLETGGRIEIGPLPTLEADPTQLRQLLQNLLGNAIKFHRPDVPPVVKLWGQILDNGRGAYLEHCVSPQICQIVVEDNGIGFEEKFSRRIFLPFQRLHGRSHYEGTGMGLAVCRRIVERHGGTIAAHSTPGQGSAFLVTLPLAQPDPTPDATADPTPGPLP